MILLHPEVAFRPCLECCKHFYDNAGKPIAGRRGERPEGSMLPCGWMREDGQWHQVAPGSDCPKGNPVVPNSLTPENMEAYQHYLECRAVGEFPRSARIRQNAGLIRWVEDAVTRSQANVSGLMVAMFGGLLRRASK